jgi:CBS domain containing-hemolysin-like protein
MDETPPNSDDASQRFWRSLRNLILGRSEGTLREQIEEAIEEHAGDGPARDDLSPDERIMLKNLLHFGEQSVDEVAVPRSKIIAFDSSQGFDQLVSLFAEAGHSRLPVYRDNLDHVLGMIHVKDAYATLAQLYRHRTGELEGEPPRTDTETLRESLLRPVLYVPSSMRIVDLLARMRSGRTHMAIVVDEYGGTDGLVTIEDLVEVIVGDIEDEHDEEEEVQLRAVGEGLYEADAGLDLPDLEEALGVAFTGDDMGDDVGTLGGLVILLAGRVPPVGEVVVHPSGWRFEVLASDTRKVSTVRLHPPALVQAQG